MTVCVCVALFVRRMEVELLLRRPLNSDADIDFTLAAAGDSMTCIFGVC